MKVTCRQCGIEFEKDEKEIRRQRKEGRDYFFLQRLRVQGQLVKWLSVKEARHDIKVGQ